MEHQAIPAATQWPLWARQVDGLASDWADWYEGSWWRGLGVVQIPFAAGAAEGFWNRYASAYNAAPPAVRARLTAPAELQTDMVSDAVSQSVEAHADVADAAKRAAESGAVALRERADAYVDRFDKAAARAGRQGVASAGMLAVGAVAILAAVYLLKK